MSLSFDSQSSGTKERKDDGGEKKKMKKKDIFFSLCIMFCNCSDQPEVVFSSGEVIHQDQVLHSS